MKKQKLSLNAGITMGQNPQTKIDGVFQLELFDPKMIESASYSEYKDNIESFDVKNTCGIRYNSTTTENVFCALIRKMGEQNKDEIARLRKENKKFECGKNGLIPLYYSLDLLNQGEHYTTLKFKFSEICDLLYPKGWGGRQLNIIKESFLEIVNFAKLFHDRKGNLAFIYPFVVYGGVIQRDTTQKYTISDIQCIKYTEIQLGANPYFINSIAYNGVIESNHLYEITCGKLAPFCTRFIRDIYRKATYYKGEKWINKPHIYNISVLKFDSKYMTFDEQKKYKTHPERRREMFEKAIQIITDEEMIIGNNEDKGFFYTFNQLSYEKNYNFRINPYYFEKVTK